MDYKKHLAKADPVMARLVKKYKLSRFRITDNPLRDLVESIISQQLSVKAAATIYKRFLALYGGKFPSAQRIIKTPPARIRSCGVSGSKSAYIKNVARAFAAGHLDRKYLAKMTDEEVRERLVAIKGVGQWTAEMFLIFSLARPDVFSPGDVGLQNAIRKQYGKKPKPATMERLSRRWSPYGSYASRLLWKSLDDK